MIFEFKNQFHLMISHSRNAKKKKKTIDMKQLDVIISNIKKMIAKDYPTDVVEYYEDRVSFGNSILLEITITKQGEPSLITEVKKFVEKVQSIYGRNVVSRTGILTSEDIVKLFSNIDDF